jgi:hypothetical protein
MYIPDGSSGYYNVQEDVAPGVGWARPKPPAKHIMESEPLLKRDLECDGGI